MISHGNLVIDCQVDKMSHNKVWRGQNVEQTECQVDITSSRQNVKQTECQADSMSSRHIVNQTACLEDRMLSIQNIKQTVLSRQHVNVKQTACLADRMSSRQNVKQTECQADRLCLNFKKASYHSFLLASLQVVLLIKNCIFSPQKNSIISLKQLSPKTHIIDCFCYILANQTHFYFA